MDLNQRQTFSRDLLGTGLAGNAADAMKYHPIWQKAFLDGETTLQFDDWIKQYLQGSQNAGTNIRDLVSP